jgi:hypothetical protein
MSIAMKRIIAKPFSSRPEPEPEVEEDRPALERPEKPSNIDTHSFASVFDDEQKMARDRSHVPAGTYKGRIRELVVQEPKHEGKIRSISLKGRGEGERGKRLFNFASIRALIAAEEAAVTK